MAAELAYAAGFITIFAAAPPSSTANRTHSPGVPPGPTTPEPP